MAVKQFLSITALILSLVLATAAQSSLIKRSTSKTDRLDFGPGGTLSVVGAPEGSITILPANGNEILIEAEIELRAATEAELTRLAEVTGFVLEEGTGRVSIITTGTHDTKFMKRVAKKFPRNLIGLPFRIDYTVRVPRYSDLEISSGKGDISIRGIEGSVKLNALETDAKLDLVGGGVSATVGKGTVSISLPQSNWRGSAIDVQLASGTMEIHFPVNLSAELDATVLRSGKIENSLVGLKPRVRTVQFTEKSIAAKSGAGGVPMRFTVGDGTLKLRYVGKQAEL